MLTGAESMVIFASEPSGTWSPLGVSIGSERSRSMLGWWEGLPTTTTSNTFCWSKKSPTTSPWVSVPAARRTSPGLRPWRSAAPSFTLTWNVGWVVGTSVSGDRTPSTFAIARRTSPAFCASTL